MPIKQVTCSLCNKTVNKAATYALSNGTRACRSHEEAQSFADAHKKEETLRLKKLSEKTPAQMRKEKWQAEFGSDPRPVTPLWDADSQTFDLKIVNTGKLTLE